MLENKIMLLEEELRKAMLSSDIKTLDELISSELLFISPRGQLVTKEMDLEAHRNKVQKMTKLDQSEQLIKIKNNYAVVTVKAYIEGTFMDFDISGLYQYLRVWQEKDGKWQITAGAATKILI